MIRTALIPGWGQWYNEQYIKGILVLGVRSYFIGQAIHFQISKNNSLNASETERFGTKRNDAIVYYGIATLISMIDAYIDAHLFDFDTGPSLDMGVGVLPFQTGFEHISPTLRLSFQAHF